MIRLYCMGIAQELNFETRKQETFATFQLANGYVFRLPVDDSTAQALISTAMGAEQPSMEQVSPTAPTMLPGPPLSADGTPNGFQPSVIQDGMQTRVFGGDAVPLGGDGPADSFQNASVVPTAPGRRPRVVGKDSNGYPILDTPGGVEPSAVTGSFGEKDEDGVSSL